MKHKLILVGIASVLLLGVAGWSLLAGSQEQRQEIYLGRGYTVGGVTLKPGNYPVIHRPEAENEGKECTYFYRMPYQAGKEAAVKLRCTPGEGAKVKEFTLKSVSQPDGTSVVKSIQFPGSTEIHNLGTGS